MTRNTCDPQRKITRWEVEQSREREFNYHLGAKDGLSLHESFVANMTEEEYLNYCDATGRA